MSPLRDQGCLWSPVLHRTRSMIWLFYAESVSCHRPANKARNMPSRWAPGGTIKYVQSEDGVVWSKPVTLWEQWKDGGVPKVIANQLVVLRSPEKPGSPGVWVLPYWQEVPSTKELVPGCPSEGESFAGALLSLDNGKTWRRSSRVEPVDGNGPVWLIEGTVAELHNGTLLQVFRSHSGILYKSVSSDSGRSWSQPRPLGLPNPNSKANLIRLEGERPLLALAYNHNETIGQRVNLWVALSDDWGETWHKVAELEGVPEDDVMQHYPTMAQSGCRLLVAYSTFYRLTPRCAASNPVCPPEPPRGQSGIRLAEIDLSKADMGKGTLIPRYWLPDNLNVNI